MGEKVTIILMKVDLQYDRCYKKIRSILCKFPEIRDQVYDEKLNVVKINVVSCCPEFIMKKIGSKGGKSIEKMDMMSLDKKKPPEEKPKEGSAGGEKTKDEKPKEGGGGGEKKKDEKPKEGGSEKKKEVDGEKNKEGGGEEKKKEGGGGGGGEKKKEGCGGGGGEKKKEGGGGGGGDKGAPEKKEDGIGDKGKDKGPPPEKKDGGVEHKLVREAPVPVSGYPSILPPVYPIKPSYPPPYYHQPVYGYGPGHNPGLYQQQQYYYQGMPGYDHYHRVGGTQYGDQYGPYYQENESTCTIM